MVRKILMKKSFRKSYSKRQKKITEKIINIPRAIQKPGIGNAEPTQHKPIFKSRAVYLQGFMQIVEERQNEYLSNGERIDLRSSIPEALAKPKIRFPPELPVLASKIKQILNNIFIKTKSGASSIDWVLVIFVSVWSRSFPLLWKIYCFRYRAFFYCRMVIPNATQKSVLSRVRYIHLNQYL